MQNLTLAIEDNVLLEARKYALEQRTTVNQLVRDYLAELVSQKERRRIARERWRALSKRGIDIGPITWRREDLYDRGR